MTASVRAHVAHERTAFQTIDVVDTDVFGRALLLDGHIQLTEMDERAYHEALVQIPLMALPEARAALVVGGGDGGVVREIARHTVEKGGGIERIDMVEIDEGVVRVCREHLPSLSDGAFDDPRVNLVVADAFGFVKEALVQSPPAGSRGDAQGMPPGRRHHGYDLIVVDSTDTYEEEEGEISEMLFTDGFYRDLRGLLAPGGIVVTQADNSVFCPYSMEEIAAMFARVFPRVGSYQALVPSFGGFSGFVWASEGRDARVPFAPRVELRYLNEATYALAFSELRFA